ncbi:MAG: helix-turn-helix domain-containing protein [Oscillospiraceae bacterium]|jgi:helix-turn-helix, psq domain
MGTKIASELWGRSSTTISRWCREGKIEGAEQDGAGSPWRIPIDAQPPYTCNRKERSF